MIECYVNDVGCGVQQPRVNNAAKKQWEDIEYIQLQMTKVIPNLFYNRCCGLLGREQELWRAPSALQ